jgi:ketosteroid isomerase-like protein
VTKARSNAQLVAREDLQIGGGDRAEAEAIFDPQVVIKPTEEGPSHGLDAIRDNIEHWKDAWEELEVTAEEFIDAGDRVLVTVHHRGRGRGSGIEVNSRFYLVYTLRDGKVARSDEYMYRAQALEAAGLRE